MRSGFRAGCLRTAAGIALLAIGSISAQAADLPSRVITPVPPVLVAPAFSWTGFYVGVSGGADFLRNRYQTNAVATGFAVDTATSAANFDQTRARVGGYVGYNYQINSNFVVGIEGDGAYDFGSTKSTSGIPGADFFVTPPSADSLSARSRYDASVRGRVGFLVTPGLLAYGTGGVAFRDASYSASCPGGSVNSYCSQNEYQSFHSTRTGYTVGGGLETVIFQNVTARVEYRYSDFGHQNLAFFGAPNDPSGDYVGARTHLTASTVTVGLAYKFDLGLGLPAAPVVARY